MCLLINIVLLFNLNFIMKQIFSTASSNRMTRPSSYQQFFHLRQAFSELKFYHFPFTFLDRKVPLCSSMHIITYLWTSSIIINNGGRARVVVEINFSKLENFVWKQKQTNRRVISLLISLQVTSAHSNWVFIKQMF